MLLIQKISYTVGITIAITVFIMIMYMILPNVMLHNQWEDIHLIKLNDEELLKKFHVMPAYVAFYERFPGASEQLVNNNRGGELEVGIANIEKGNYLKLELNYYERDDQVKVRIDCRASNNDQNTDTRGLFVVDFIKYTDCLDIEPLLDTQDTTFVYPRPGPHPGLFSTEEDNTPTVVVTTPTVR